ncbi:MAG: hypothetical protein IJ439_03525 [Tyzzerella sp.]|nr:hypothetical protein [Tyzzerella sp.]
MNSYRKWMRVFLIIGVCLICVACGNKEPNTVREDLEKELLVYNSNFKMKDYEITQSMTEDKNYSGTASVQAESKFAKINLIADFLYTKYDQGWQLDYCSFNIVDYEIVKELDEGYIFQLYSKQNGERGHAVNYDENELTDERFVAYGTFYLDKGDYLNVEGDVQTTWIYDIEQDEWVVEQEKSNSYNILDYDVQGTWKQYDDNDCIYIKNQSKEGFDVKVEGISDLPEEWIHVELVTNDKDSKQEAVYKGDSSNGRALTVKFSDGKQSEFRVYVDIGGWFNSRWSYLRDFTPSK